MWLFLKAKFIFVVVVSTIAWWKCFDVGGPQISNTVLVCNSIYPSFLPQFGFPFKYSWLSWFWWQGLVLNSNASLCSPGCKLTFIDKVLLWAPKSLLSAAIIYFLSLLKFHCKNAYVFCYPFSFLSGPLLFCYPFSFSNFFPLFLISQRKCMGILELSYSSYGIPKRNMEQELCILL